MEEGIMKSIRDALFMKVTALSMDFFARKKTGDIMSLLTNDVSVLNGATVNSLTTIWREGTTILIYLALLLAISPTLTLIAIGISLGGLILIRTTTGVLRRYGARMQSAQANYTSTLQESVLGIRVVKALGIESTMVKRFTDQTSHYVRMALRNTRISGLVPLVNDTFGILALVGVFYAGGSALAAGDIQPSNLVTFLFLLFGLMQPITTTVSTIANMQRGIAAADNVVNLLEEKPSIAAGDVVPPTFTTALSVKDLTFSYGDGPVLRNVSFTLRRGETIALVGASGSGKSTMLDLLLRFYDPTSGVIEFDGTDIRAFDLVSYRKQFGMVSQETILFNDTVANNISLGYGDANDENIRRAARIAHAETFINQLPETYQTSIGDRGMRLSGGQRQRLAIARAVVRDPQILLFDEATSALDTESERIVQEAISDVLQDRTAVIVAHRLSTIVNADRILVFEHGCIVEEGTHDALLSRGGVYAKLHAMQYANDSNDQRS
jgi:subfamily B ATP-binding cassette protein MsbA